MKLFCAQRDLDYGLNIVNKAISPNNTLPVLNNILLRAEGKKLYFSSTNLEIAISCSIDAEVRSEGSITVPAILPVVPAKEIVAEYKKIIKTNKNLPRMAGLLYFNLIRCIPLFANKNKLI